MRYEPATPNEHREMVIVAAAKVWRLRRMLLKAEAEYARLVEVNDGEK